MRDLEDMKNWRKEMYSKFENDFDKFIYDYSRQGGNLVSVNGSIKENGFTFSKVMLTDEIRNLFQIDDEYEYVIIQEAIGGLITTFKVSRPPIKEEDQTENIDEGENVQSIT